MRRWILIGSSAALVLMLAPLVASAAPAKEHFRDVGTDTDTNFCGTGKTVEIGFDVLVNLFFTPGAQEGFDKITQSGKLTFTNPANGKTVLVTFAGQTQNTIVEGNESGVHTHVFTTKGLPEMLRVPGGGVLTRDAGLIVERVTFDENDEVIAYEASWRGPHPEAASEFALFCEVMTEALEL